MISISKTKAQLIFFKPSSCGGKRAENNESITVIIRAMTIPETNTQGTRP